MSGSPSPSSSITSILDGMSSSSITSIFDGMSSSTSIFSGTSLSLASRRTSSTVLSAASLSPALSSASIKRPKSCISGARPYASLSLIVSRAAWTSAFVLPSVSRIRIFAYCFKYRSCRACDSPLTIPAASPSTPTNTPPRNDSPRSSAVTEPSSVPSSTRLWNVGSSSSATTSSSPSDTSPNALLSSTRRSVLFFSFAAARLIRPTSSSYTGFPPNSFSENTSTAAFSKPIKIASPSVAPAFFASTAALPPALDAMDVRVDRFVVSLIGFTPLIPASPASKSIDPTDGRFSTTNFPTSLLSFVARSIMRLYSSCHACAPDQSMSVASLSARAFRLSRYACPKMPPSTLLFARSRSAHAAALLIPASATACVAS